MGLVPRLKSPVVMEHEAMIRKITRKREDILRLVQAQIVGGVELSPEEMIDAAFLMVERIESRLYGKE